MVHTDLKQILTSMGHIRFHKTLFKHKETGKCEYLLDRYLKIESHERISEDAKACVPITFRYGSVNRTDCPRTVNRI